MDVNDLVRIKDSFEASDEYGRMPKKGTKVRVCKTGRGSESFICGAVGIVDGYYLMPTNGLWINFRGVIVHICHSCSEVPTQRIFTADVWERVPPNTELGFEGKGLLVDGTEKLRAQIKRRGMTCYCCGHFKDEHKKDFMCPNYRWSKELETNLARAARLARRWRYNHRSRMAGER